VPAELFRATGPAEGRPDGSSGHRHAHRLGVPVHLSARCTGRRLPQERVSCGDLGELLIAVEGGREGEEGGEQAGFAFVAEGQPAVPGQPGDRAFDSPAVAAQPGGRFDAAAGDARDDAPVAEELAQVGVVVALSAGSLPGRRRCGPMAGPDRPDRLYERDQTVAVVGVRRRDRDRQGSPPASVSTCSLELACRGRPGWAPSTRPRFRPHAGRVNQRPGPVHRAAAPSRPAPPGAA
jgi:hypothetical protein